MCLDAEQLILPEEPVLTQNPNAHQCKMWDLCAKAATNKIDKLRQNLRALYPVVNSLCDANMEDKVKAHECYAEIKHNRYTLKLLQVIK